MNIFIDFIDYYDQIITVFFFKNGVCHLSGDGRGERYFLKKKFSKILLSLFFSQIWRMASQYDEEHFTLVSSKFILYLFTKINKLTFFKVNVIFYCKLILSAFK